MGLEFYSFLCDQVRALKKNGDNTIVKDDEFKSLWEEKEIFTWSIYSNLFLFYKISSRPLEGNGFFQERLFEMSKKVSDGCHKVWAETDLPPSNIVNKYVIAIINQNYSHIENFKKFISQGYDPPDDIDILLSHLGTLYLFYVFLSSHDIIPINLVSRIDLVITRLISKATIMITLITEKGGDIERTKRSITTRQENAKRQMEKIISIYKKNRETNRRWEDPSHSDSLKAKIIADAFRSKGEKPPGESTIRRDIRIARGLGYI